MCEVFVGERMQAAQLFKPQIERVSFPNENGKTLSGIHARCCNR
jgi:hypothetical protein